MSSAAISTKRHGVSIKAWTWDGAPPGALLLHGIGNYGRYWDFVADAIASRLRLVAPDARGHGESDAPSSGYAEADQVADALAIADAAGLTRFIAAGHSLGGRHALALAAAARDRVIGLLLVDAGPDVLPEGRERAMRLTAQRPESFAHQAEARDYLHRTSPGYSRAVYDNRLRFGLRERGDGRLEWRSSREALLATMRSSSLSETVWTALESIRCPLVVLRGTRSSSLSHETAQRMIELAPGARLVEVDSGHNVPLERPKETADELLRLARETSTG